MSFPNLSILAIPIYYSLTIYPHAYAQSEAKAALNTPWNNANPHSTTWDAHLRKTLPASTYGIYSRGEAAHRNGMENLPIFVGAIILGNMAKLSTGSLNTFVVGYLVARCIYTALYLRTESISKSYWRTAAWGVSTIWAFGVIGRAGWVLA